MFTEDYQCQQIFTKLKVIHSLCYKSCFDYFCTLRFADLESWKVEEPLKVVFFSLFTFFKDKVSLWA